MKLASATALAAVLAAVPQAHGQRPNNDNNNCVEEIQGIWQYLSNGSDNSPRDEYLGGGSGLPYTIVIACTTILEDSVAGRDDNNELLEWKKGDTRCQYSEVTFESDCNAVGYFTTDQISVVDGNCAWGYDPDDIESNDGMVVLEGLYEGTKNACKFTEGGIFRGKGVLKKNGIHEMRYTDNGGESLYNNNFPRMGAPYHG
ncbi:hypothetical protein ACHAXT_002646 [Thalassiosira profunda]